MLEICTYGNKVVHPRAVELSEFYGIPLEVASSFNDNPGTLIQGGNDMEVRNKVRAIAHDLDVAKITIVGVPDKPGVAASIFVPLAQAGVSVDTIVQNSSVQQNITDLTFTVSKNDLMRAMEVVKPIAKAIGARDCLNDANLGKVSIMVPVCRIPLAMQRRCLKTLAEHGINIQLITTSEIRITCIIAEAQVKEAVRVLHSAFQMDVKD